MMKLFALMLNSLFFIPLVYAGYKKLRNCEVTEKTWKQATVTAVAGTFFLWLILQALSVYTEALWFEQMGQAVVFWTIFKTKWLLYLFPFVAFILTMLLTVNWLFKASPTLQAEKMKDEHERSGVRNTYRSGCISKMIKIGRVEKAIRFPVIIIASGLASIYAKIDWQNFLLWRHQAPTGLADPIFHKDLAFFLFSYPLAGNVLHLLVWLLITLACCYLYVLFFHLFYGEDLFLDYGSDEAQKKEKELFYSSVIKKASLLALVGVVVLMANFWYSIYSIMYLQSGRFFGPGYMAVNHMVLSYKIAIVSTAVGFIGWLSAFMRSQYKKALIVGIAQIAVYILVLVVYPFYVQKRVVEPQEFDIEAPYIGHSIQMTRQAYGLTDVELREMPVINNLDPVALDANKGTLNNIRLWDYRVLKSSYQQLQGIRSYYEFGDVDVDRYYLNGEYRQVMLGVRELNTSKLSKDVQASWVNLRTTYTHGYGLCLNATNEATAEGFPHLLVQDIPVASSVKNLKITRPQIYFGEKTDEHVYVYTSPEAKEFDYGKGDKNEYRKYDGTGGVKLDSFLKKLAYAWEFQELNLLLSGYISSDSRVMYYRNVTDRISKLTPFLARDNDAYPVINANGGIDYMLDLYSLSSSYPYSEPYSNEGDNYVRNSVKATVNAYDGTVNFYVFDGNDPVINAWMRIFPSLFRAKAEMPADLLAHVRYPEGLMLIQSDIYKTYHMDDLRVFFGKEDQWSIAKEVYMDEAHEIEPYYGIMKFSAKEKEEFVLMRPFTPMKKQNMIGWLAGRSDGGNYGKLLCYMLPKGKQIFGPEQIETKIDQDKEMSQELTLWKQKGSDVIRGNLLVIPIGDTFIYVKPIFLKAVREGSESSAIPQLTKVVLAYGDSIVWGDTFETAFEQMFGQTSTLNPAVAVESTTGVATLAGKSAIDETARSLVKKANENLIRYFELMGKGKSKDAGEALEEVKKSLENLNKRGVL